MRDSPQGIFQMLRASFWSAGFLSYLALLIFGLATLFALTPDILDWINTPPLPEEYIFTIFPPVLLLRFDGMAFQVWHIILLGILTICLSYGMYGLYGSWTSRKGNATRSLMRPEKTKSGVEEVGKLMMAVTFFSYIYIIFLSIIGPEPAMPEFYETYSTNELLYRLFSASVYEELISRLMLIGLPLFILAILLNWKGPYYKFLLGGKMRLNILTLALLIFSSLLFAIVHLWSWELWKIPQVFISGMALGYVFLRFGLFASILLHFSVNFITTAPVEIWPDANHSFLGMIILIWIVAGSYLFIDYSFRFAGKIKKIFRKDLSIFTGDTKIVDRNFEDEHGARPVKQKQRKMDNGFVCPFCNNITAKYENGKFICLKCNKLAYQKTDDKEEEKIDLEATEKI